jgi:hypothetical protein
MENSLTYMTRIGVHGTPKGSVLHYMTPKKVGKGPTKGDSGPRTRPALKTHLQF